MQRGSDQNRWQKCKEGMEPSTAIEIAGTYAEGQRSVSLAAIRIAGAGAMGGGT